MSIKKLIKRYFTLDHYHYARWLSVHLYDLIHLYINCPDVYEAFVSGMFSFGKTTRPFSSIAPDQLHEQNNEVIKSFGGATVFLNREDQSRLERWGLCSSEFASILADYEKSSNTNFNVNRKHHEDTAAFQKPFTSDVRKVVRSMVANPFQQDTLARIDNTTIQYDVKVLVDLKQFLDKGQEQAKQFWD